MIKRAIFSTAAALAFAAIPATSALADAGGIKGGPGYSPPPAAVSSCDSDHGAFGAFGGKYSNFGVNDLGSNGVPGAANPHAPASGGLTTGEANSGASATCNGH